MSAYIEEYLRRNGVSNYLTKYFKPADKHYFRDGEIRFGSLSSYRSAEFKRLDKYSRFDDPLEGHDLTMIDLIAAGGDVTIGDWSLRGSDITIRNSILQRSYEEYAFCATNGHYRKEHHQVMLHGNEDYLGDAQLISYCVFDTRLLIEAILKISLHSSAERSRPELSPIAVHRVTYDKIIDFVSVCTPGPFSYAGTRINPFAKPPQFAAEDEVRILIDVRRGRGVLRHANSINLRSRHIASAVVEWSDDTPAASEVSNRA